MARTECSFQKNGKERPEQNVLFKRTENNGRNRMFFSKERKKTAGTERSFQKNAKERTEWNVPYKRTDETECSFHKNGWPIHP